MRTPCRRAVPRLGLVLAAVVFALGFAAPTWAAPAPVTLRVAPGADPKTLDGPLTGDATHRPLALALADFLVTTDPGSGFAVPGLADSWTIEDGGVTWTFSLKAARWSDGSPLTSQDVAAAWSRPSAPADPLGNLVLSSSFPDARHLKVTFQDPVPSPAVFATWRWAVIGSDPALRTSGPFRIETSSPGKSLTVVKNSQYRDASSIRFDRVTFVFTDTPATAELLYRKGEVDWVSHGGGPGTAVSPAMKDAVVSPGWGTTFLRFNLGLPPGSDPALRKLLAAALDRASLASDLRGPLQVPSATLLPPSTLPAADAKRPKVVPPVGTAPFSLLHAAGETNRHLAEAVALQWAGRLGLTVDPQEVASTDYLSNRKRGLYQVALAGWLGDYPDPLTFLLPFRSDSPSNDTGWSNPTYDKLLDRIAGMAAGKARDRAVDEALSLLLEGLPVIPLTAQATVNQINLKRWKGWTANPTDYHPWNGFGPKK